MKHQINIKYTYCFYSIYLLSSLNTADFDTSSDNYIGPEIRLEGTSPYHNGDHYVGRLRGYFVPPRDGDYRLWIRGDDENQLFFSETGDAEDIVRPSFI